MQRGASRAMSIIYESLEPLYASTSYLSQVVRVRLDGEIGWLATCPKGHDVSLGQDELYGLAVCVCPLKDCGYFGLVPSVSLRRAVKKWF